MRRKQQDKKCATKFCTRPRRKRNGRSAGSYCTTCEKKRWRKKNPMKAAFETLRNNATRRKKEFTLTFEEFKKFCFETNYMAGKGRSSKSFSIDRVDNTKGYVSDNIRMLTHGENARKGNKV